MTVPDFQSLMLPALRALGDQSPSTTQQVRAKLAAEFALSDVDLSELLPSGRQTTFANRVAWAYSYMKQAGLISSPKRGVYELTPKGRDTLVSKPQRIDISFLSKFPEFVAFRTPVVGSTVKAATVEVGQSELTPDEQIRTGYKRLREALALQLLERARTVNPSSFERLVVDVLVGLGYGGSRFEAGEVVGGSGDEGIDGIIKEDRLGFDSIYVQAKRWQNTVGRPDIQRFAGALQGQRARKGIFITTSAFSAEAVAYAKGLQTTIVLIDGPQLAELMIDAGVAVSPAEEIRILKIDEDYFDALDAG